MIKITDTTVELSWLEPEIAVKDICGYYIYYIYMVNNSNNSIKLSLVSPVMNYTITNLGELYIYILYGSDNKLCKIIFLSRDILQLLEVKMYIVLSTNIFKIIMSMVATILSGYRIYNIKVTDCNSSNCMPYKGISPFM